MTFVLHKPIALPLSAFAGGLLIGSMGLFGVYLRAASARGVLLGYRWISADYTYSISSIDPREHRQDVTIVIEAIRPRVTNFENRFLWTGHGKIGIEADASNQTLGALYQFAGWTYYSINLGRELAVGERERVVVSQLLYDQDESFEFFLAKTLTEPISELSLHVNLPKPPLKAVRTEYSGPPPAGEIVKRSSVESPGALLEWHIYSPILRHRYEIRWEPCIKKDG